MSEEMSLEAREKQVAELIKDNDHLNKVIDADNIRLGEIETLLESVNEHAETCSVFIYDDKGCTCYYEKIREYLGE